MALEGERSRTLKPRKVGDTSIEGTRILHIFCRVPVVGYSGLYAAITGHKRPIGV